METGLAVVTSPVSGQAETRTLAGGVLPTAQVAPSAGDLAAGLSLCPLSAFRVPLG